MSDDSRGPGVGEPVVRVIFKYCRWTENMLENYPRPFDGALVVEAICIGVS